MRRSTELLATIKRLKALLKDPRKIKSVIKDELPEIKRKYADPPSDGAPGGRG